MSSASTWLGARLKTELVEIADKVGLKNYENLKKAELVTALDEHMRSNSSTFSQSTDTSLVPYYKKLDGQSSPATKKDVAATETKTPRRRTTKAKEELEAETSAPAGTSTTLATRTPNQRLAFASNVPLPPSPAVVASHIDRQAAKVRTTLNRVYRQSGMIEYVDNVRDKVSTTASIETIAIAIELFGLRRELLPTKYLATIPASKTIGTSELPIKVPDLFVLVTPDFWSTFLLWFSTSVLIPMTFSYFFNLTLKAKHGHVRNAKGMHASNQYDPLTFNISKALFMWLVYGKGVTLFGWPGVFTTDRVDYNVPGGYQGVLIACGIGTLTSLYEAVLNK